MKKKTIINKRIELVCSVINNKVYYTVNERKKMERKGRRAFLLQELNKGCL